MSKQDVITLIIIAVLLLAAGIWITDITRESMYACITPLAMLVTMPAMVVDESATVNFELTAYCPCEICCGIWADGVTSTGTIAQANHTIAVDPSVIPYGTIVIIDGDEYVAEDCGGAIKGNRIDIYMDTHKEALEFGRQFGKVEVIKTEGR